MLAFGAGFALVQLSRKEVRIAGTNSLLASDYVARATPAVPVCIDSVLVPADSAGLRVLVQSKRTPPPTLTARLENLRTKTAISGRVSNYRSGDTVTIPFQRVQRDTGLERLCLTVEKGAVELGGPAEANQPGAPNSLVDGGFGTADQVSLQFVRPGKESLLRLSPTVFKRIAVLGPGWAGAWTYWALLVLLIAGMIAAVVLLSRYAVTSPSLRFAVAAVAGLAFLNAAIWGIVDPPLQPPDETAHYAYVESIVETGSLPDTEPFGAPSYGPGTELAVSSLAGYVLFRPESKPPWTQQQRRGFLDAVAALGDGPDKGGGGYTTATGSPPLYYLAEAGPYAVTQNTSIFTRVWMMRLLSALMAAATVALTFLFAREIFPRVEWAAPAAALMVAYQPMFLFMGGAINNDTLLILCATLELYLLARAINRGLTPRLALAIGAALGIGMLAKPNMIALLPVVALMLIWTALRSGMRLRALTTTVGLCGLAFLTPLALNYGLYDGRGGVVGVGTASDAANSAGSSLSLNGFLSYTWEWYLPRLSFMHAFFGGTPPVYDNYFKGFWANFGHLDTRFPETTYRVLAWASVAIVAFASITLYRLRRSWRELLPRVALVVLATAAFAVMVNLFSYIEFTRSGGPFAQGRYLLPAVAVVGVVVVAAALAFGRRWSLAAGTAIVSAAAVLNTFSLGLLLTRYYV